MQTLKRGVLITFEGIDGSGKSTLARSLHQQFAQDNLATILTKEPGGSQLGKQLRAILQEQPVPVCSMAEYLMFAADRAQHFKEVIIPHLEKNYLILSDRMADSSLVYQGYGRGLDIPMIKSINAWTMQNIKPDLTVYVHIPAQVSFDRIAKRNEKLTAFEKEDKAFCERLVQGFDELLKNQEHVILIDGTESMENVFKNTYHAVTTWLNKQQLLQ